MGTSHVRSNLQGLAGTETITNFATVGDTSTALVGLSVTSSGAIAGTTIGGTVLTGSTGVVGTSYVKVAGVYIMSSAVPTNTSASIVAAARAIITPVPKGSVYLNASPGAIWVFTASSVAATVLA